MPTEKTALREDVKSISDRVTDIQDEIGNCFCCRKLAPIRFNILQKNRRFVMKFTHYLCMFAIAVNAIGFWGAFSHGTTLKYLSWLRIYTPRGEMYGGVIHMCANFDGRSAQQAAKAGSVTVDPKHTAHPKHAVPINFLEATADELVCRKWGEIDCESEFRGRRSSYCTVCASQSYHVAFSIFVGLVSYIMYFNNNDKRYNGDDSNLTKFSCCASAIGNGLSLSLNLFVYWNYCVHVASTMPRTEIYVGPGFILVLIATFLKFCMGVVHVGLPVQRVDENKDGEWTM